MSSWEMKIIRAEAERLMALAAEDAGLRAELRSLADAILTATEDSRPHPDTKACPPADVAPQVSTSGAAPASAAGGDEPGNPNTPEVAQTDPPRVKESLKELTLGRSRPPPDEPRSLPGATTGTVVTDADLPEIEARCRLKAEGARWASARLRRIREGTDPQAGIALEDPEIATWADRLMDRFCWLNSPDASQPADISILDDVGGCFATVAEAIALVLDTGVGHRGRLEQALPLLAEAQSALRAAIRGIQAPDDPDQLQIFDWVKATAARQRVYLRRFMRADDPADPSRWPDLLDRIEGLPLRSPQARKQSRQQGSRASRKPSAGVAPAREPSAEVKEARRLLGGRSVVLIGGSCRRDAQEALETALGLKELTWIETSEHQSIGAFEPFIARPDVALVLLAIRWSSHAFGDVRQFCDRHGKPLVRLPGGYSPNQVAAQILSQCSEQLGGG